MVSFCRGFYQTTDQTTVNVSENPPFAGLDDFSMSQWFVNQTLQLHICNKTHMKQLMFQDVYIFRFMGTH